MAGILDWIGAQFGSDPSAPSGGILGSAAQPPASSGLFSPKWADRLNLIGSTFQDIGSHLAGDRVHANNLDQYFKQAKTQQLLANMNSPDPATRQLAYSHAMAMGIDPSMFQKSQASQALPKLMDFMQPQEGVKVTPQMGALGAGDSVAARTASGAYNGVVPGQSLPQALQSVGSPELTSQLAPQIIAQAEKANEPYTLTPGAVRFQNGAQVASAPEKPPADPELVKTAKFLFPTDAKLQADYITKNSPANVKSITNVNTEGAGWQMAVDPANNNTPFRLNVRTGESIGLDGQPYVPKGYGKVSTNNPRTAVAIYMDKWKQEHPNASSADTMTAMNMFTGQQAENRTLGTQGAKVESANAGLDTVIGQAKGAYAKLPRGQFVPFNKLAQMAATGAFSSPEQADAYAADTGVINLWGKAINPNGVLTVEAQRRGEQMLSQAQSIEAHNAVYDRMLAEGTASVGGVNKFRPPGGNVPASGAPPGPASCLPKLPAGPKIRVFNPKTGKLE